MRQRKRNPCFYWTAASFATNVLIVAPEGTIERTAFFEMAGIIKGDLVVKPGPVVQGEVELPMTDLNSIILPVLIIGLITAAFMAVYLNEATYSIGALSSMLIILAVIYIIYGAIFAAIFQLAVGASALGVLFLAGEMIGKKTEVVQSPGRITGAIIIGILISLPSLFFTVSTTPSTPSPPSSQIQDLLNLQSIDMVLQGLVILVIAMGIAIVLYERKKNKGASV